MEQEGNTELHRCGSSSGSSVADQAAPLEAHLPEVQPSTGLKPIARVTASNKAATRRARASGRTSVARRNLNAAMDNTSRRMTTQFNAVCVMASLRCPVCDPAVFLLRVTLLSEKACARRLGSGNSSNASQFHPLCVLTSVRHPAAVQCVRNAYHTHQAR